MLAAGLCLGGVPSGGGQVGARLLAGAASRGGLRLLCRSGKAKRFARGGGGVFVLFVPVFVFRFVSPLFFLGGKALKVFSSSSTLFPLFGFPRKMVHLNKVMCRTGGQYKKPKGNQASWVAS